MAHTSPQRRLLPNDKPDISEIQPEERFSRRVSNTPWYATLQPQTLSKCYQITKCHAPASTPWHVAWLPQTPEGLCHLSVFIQTLRNDPLTVQRSLVASQDMGLMLTRAQARTRLDCVTGCLEHLTSMFFSLRRGAVVCVTQ